MPPSESSPLLSNPRSERVKAVAALGRRAVRERQRLFLAEGPQAVRELLTHAAPRATALYLTDVAAQRYPEILQKARQVQQERGAGRDGLQVFTCTEAVLAAMADTDSPQGMVAVAEQIDLPLEQVLDAIGDHGFAVILTHVRDPGNAGTVLRGADAFGAAAVLISSASVDIYNPKVVRSTVGSLFHLPISMGTPVQELLAACRERGIRLLAADAAGSTTLADADLSGPHAWVMGNEAWGLAPEVLDACDRVVSIPINRAESLNLAMAATVCLHTSANAGR